MSTTQYSASEPVTSVTHLTTAGGTGEAYSGPIVIGHYTNGDGEVWIEQEGKRVDIPAEHFKAVIKNLQRAHQIAKENAQ